MRELDELFCRAHGGAPKGAEQGKDLLRHAACRLRSIGDLKDVPDAADGGPAQDELEEDAGATDD